MVLQAVEEYLLREEKKKCHYIINDKARLRYIPLFDGEWILLRSDWQSIMTQLLFVPYLVQFFWKLSDKYKRAKLEKGEPGKGRNFLGPNLKMAETSGNCEIIALYANII